VSLRANRVLAVLALLAVCAIWGATFVVVKDAIARMSVADFLAWRFALAAVAMVALRPNAVRQLGAVGRRDGVLLGLALGAGYLLQTYGLRSTPASVSGFITGMFVVFTPLGAGILLRRPVGPMAWLAVVVATVGLGLLALRGFAVGTGELLTLGCALAFAIHIVGLGEWSAGRNPVALAVVQLATVAALGAVAALLAGGAVGLRPPPDAGVWGALALTALAATALAFVVQTWAQSLLSPTRAAVVMTTEPVFAGIFGVALAGDQLGWRQLAGAGLVLIAMLLVEARPRRFAGEQIRRLEI